MLAISIPPPCIPSYLPAPSRFLARPQLLTRCLPLPRGRDLTPHFLTY
jgi:hypothetical protein